MIKSWFVNEDGRLRSYVPWTILVLALAFASMWVYRVWTRDSGSHAVAMMCKTPGCSFTRAEKLQVGETLPLECPKCGNKSVVPSFACKACGTPNVWNEDRGLKPPTKCTKCGKEHYHGQ